MLKFVASASIVIAIVTLPMLYRSLRSEEYRNFRVVVPGVLYRSGQMSPEGFERVFREFGIKTVISFRGVRDDGRDTDDEAEVEVCRRLGVQFVRFPLADWEPVDGVIPADQNVSRFLAMMDDPNVEKPVLVHCFAGIHRTGSHCAVYRMTHCGWNCDEAIREMEAMGTSRTTFAPNLIDYLRNYSAPANSP